MLNGGGSKARQWQIDNLTQEDKSNIAKKREKILVESGRKSKIMRNANVKRRPLMESLGYWLPEDQLTDFELYRKQVWKRTNSQKLESLPHYEKRNHYSNDGWSLDHKYSIKQGFVDKISPEIIGNIANLEMLPCVENSRKSDKCSITISELHNKLLT